MYAQVVVLTYQPPDIPAYTYEIPEELEKEINIGQLVSVPFGKRSPIGIIIDINEDIPRKEIQARNSLEVKFLSSIIIKNAILLPYQIDLLKWMAFYYHAPMVNCLEAMLPTKALNAKRLMTNAEKLESVQRLALGVQQTSVLVPTINRLPETLAQYPNAKNYVIYHNELRPKDRFEVWQKILSRNVDYVFGSRSAIFSPCPNLQEIIIYDEHEGGYCDERSPYYSTLTIAEKLEELTGAKLKIIDSSPRITTYFNHGSEFIRKKSSARINLASPNVKIVNMLDERKAGNRSPLSQLLEEYIKKGLAKNKKILLFLNKKSESGHIWCKNCKYSGFVQKQPEVCPQCQSIDVFFNSTNVNSLANLVKKIVPGASVNIIARINLTGNIDIATASVFYKLATYKYDLVAHIQTDSLLSVPDYTSAEKLFAQIASLKKITKSLLLLQTYGPQNPTITLAAQGNWQKFYQSQLAERKALSYPPFTLLVKLSLKGKKEESVKQNAQKLFDELNNEPLTKARSPKDEDRMALYINHKPLTILGPYKPAAGGKLSKYNIILKIPLAGYLLKDRQIAVSKVSSLLSTVPKGTQIEVEANSLN